MLQQINKIQEELNCWASNCKDCEATRRMKKDCGH